MDRKQRLDPSLPFGRHFAVPATLVVTAVLLLGTPSLHAQWGRCGEEHYKLTGSDTQRIDSFGCAVTSSGDVTVIGARYDTDAGSFGGTAFVFRWDGA